MIRKSFEKLKGKVTMKQTVITMIACVIFLGGCNLIEDGDKGFQEMKNSNWKLKTEVILDKEGHHQFSPYEPQYVVDYINNQQLNFYNETGEVVFSSVFPEGTMMLLWSPLEKQVVHEAGDRTLSLIDITKKEVRSSEIKGDPQVWSPDGSKFIAKKRDQNLFQIVDIQKMQVVQTFTLSIPDKPKGVLEWLDEDLILVRGMYILRIQENGATSVVESFPEVLKETVTYDASTQTILYGKKGGSLYLYDIETQKKQKLNAPAGRTYRSPNESKIAIHTGLSIESEERLYIYDVENDTTQSVLSRRIDIMEEQDHRTVKWLDNQNIVFNVHDGTKHFNYLDVLVIYNIENQKITFTHNFNRRLNYLYWHEKDNTFLYKTELSKPLMQGILSKN